MTVSEIATLLGEFAFLEIDNVSSVNYIGINDRQTAFVVVMENGNQYSVDIKIIDT